MSEHPEHDVVQVVPGDDRNPGGIWEVAIPAEPRGWTGIKARRACRRAGGHWWHPADAMIAWGCCGCGARRDGWPKDGT